MSDERFNTQVFIAEEGTPDQCVGCHTPFLKAEALETKVHEGEITDDEATILLRTDLEENCKFGRAATLRKGKVVGSRCMNLVVCKPSFVPYPAERRRWDWETAE